MYSSAIANIVVDITIFYPDIFCIHNTYAGAIITVNITSRHFSSNIGHNVIEGYTHAVIVNITVTYGCIVSADKDTSH